jgi:hypothetical protein
MAGLDVIEAELDAPPSRVDELGADPSMANSETGRTTLDQATERGHHQIVDLLRRHSSSPPGPP